MSEPRGVTGTAVAPQPQAAGRASGDPAHGWARLVALATGAPAAAVWLRDGDRFAVADRWGGSGRPAEPLLRAALPLAELVRERGEPYAVADTRVADPDTPRAFLGVAVPDRDGRTVGVVAALDSRPRDWRPADYTTLRDIAGLVSAAHSRSPAADRSGALLTALLENLDQVMVAACDAEGRITLLHEAFRALPDLPGSVRAEVDREVAALFHPDGRPLRIADSPLARAHRGERLRDVQVHFRPAAGLAQVWAVNASPVRHPDGRLAGAVAAVHDVSAERRRQRERDCELAVSRAVTGTAEAPDDVYAAVLRALVGALRAARAELWLDDVVGGRSRCAASYPAADADPADLAAPALVAPLVLGEHRFGSLRVVGTTVDGARELAAGVADQVCRYLEQRRAASLAEELSRTRDEFIALAGHALRTPLTAIASLAGVLREGDADADLAGQRTALLSRIESNAAALRGIVEDLLDLAGLESGDINLMHAPVDLAELVGQRLAALAPPEKVTLRVDLPPALPMTGDRTRLSQVVDNLVSNAVKYSPAGGEVRVVLRGRDGVAELTVADHGLGVPAAERDKLFHRFYRGTTAHERGIPGTGLGLALTRVIVERHGGTVALDDQDGPGAAFTVRLPVAPPQ
ncbi:hypothetical protein GCM10010124_38780 [Pilimelia terevasa]|uniref:histidine kinase n=1 Tax=Pilimelia terevasa TaxID=53372 RepID=A0A8J3BQC9_9ACTN|nr:PAS domain-containing sensor histidine kinase [Pilimelia terevasa]GGK42196.1 hypothetical protein GCM10010124_38780 [Pilimelia terevasa]